MRCTTPDRIAVIGGGIAGLAVAAALGRHGRRCTVYERADRLDEVGAGIQISPNAARLLHRLGLAERLDAVADRPEAIELRRWEDGEPLGRTELGAGCVARYGAPYYTVHRADLHSALLDAATRTAPVRLGRRCVGVDEHAVRFADGRFALADLVIGADGVRSTVRAELVADRPRFGGIAVYRALVPADRLPRLANPATVRIWLGPGQHCVCYPIRGGRWLNLVATAPTRESTVESWTSGADVAALAAAYTSWNRDVRELVSAVDTALCFVPHDRPPLARWYTRRLALVGDAAHAMLPFGAQGANQAIEDAAALAACLASARPDVALPRYDRVRRARVAQVGAATREHARTHHLADGGRQRDRDRALVATAGLDAHDWLYGYDAELAVAR